MHNQQNRRALFVKEADFQNTFEKAYNFPDFFAYRVKGYLERM